MAVAIEKTIRDLESRPSSCKEVLGDQKKCDALRREVEKDPLVDFFTKPAYVPTLLGLGFGISVGCAFMHRLFFSSKE